MTTLTRAEYAALGAKPQRNKFGAKKTEIDGIRFDSKREAARYGELLIMQRAGEISHLECQPKFWLEMNGKSLLIKSDGYPNGRRASFKPDFAYLEIASDTRVVEDVKSSATTTEAYKLRRAWFEAQFPSIRFVEVM